MADASPIKAPICKHNVVTGYSLTKNSTTIIRDPFPLGEAYRTILLTFKHVLTIGTGTTALVDALSRIVRDIMIRTDRDDIIVKAPGRALLYRALKVCGTLPAQTTFAASTGTYYVTIPIHLANPRMRRPDDTCLNTARYKNMELHITMGDENDLLGTPGTASDVITLDVSVEKTMFAVDASNAPIFVPYIMALPAVDPNSFTTLDLEKNPDLGLLDVTMFTSNTNIVAGRPFSGTASDAVVSTVTLYDNIMSTFRNLPFYQLQADNKSKFQFETTLSGFAIFDFIEDWSAFSGLPTGDKSVLRLEWVNGTPTGAQVSALMDGIKRMR